MTVTVEEEEPQPDGEYVQSLARGLAVIRAFDTDHPVMTLSEVAARVGLTRATARRCLHTLARLEYVWTDGKIFRLTPRVLQLGYAYLSGLTLPQLAQPHLETLSLKLGESTSAAVLDGTDIIYVARVSTRRIMNVGITVGTRFPAYATSMGRVLLAGLSETELRRYLATVKIEPLTPRTLGTASELLEAIQSVRSRGWCLLNQELELGLMSVAAPLFDGDRVVAAINVSLQAQSVASKSDPEAYLSSIAQATVGTAKLISAELRVQR